MNAKTIHANRDTDAAWDYLVESGIAETQTLQVAVTLNGYSYKTLCDVLFILSGERDFGQLDEDEDED